MIVEITWFHILLARNKIFPFRTVTSHQPHFANKRWSCLKVKIQASGNSNVCLAVFWKQLYHGLVWCPINITIPFSSFVVDIIDSCFVASHRLANFPDHDAFNPPTWLSSDTWSDTLKPSFCTKYMKQSFKPL